MDNLREDFKNWLVRQGTIDELTNFLECSRSTIERLLRKGFFTLDVDSVNAYLKEHYHPSGITLVANPDFLHEKWYTIAEAAEFLNCSQTTIKRLIKNTYELNKLRKEGKIEVHFLREQLIIHKDSNSLEINFWNMHVLMANAQVNNMIDKVKASQAKNWSLGKCQGYAPLGYLNTKDENYRSTVILDEVRAPIITKLFEEYATGNHSIDSIWQLSKTLGLYTKMKSRRGNFVSKNTIYDILTNPFYYGEMCIKGEFISHIYPHIVSRSLFDKVQEIFAQNGNHNRNDSENQAKYTYAFRGLIKCKECGGLITPATAIKKNGSKYSHLRCANYKKCCHQAAVMEYVIFEQLEKEVFNKLSLPSNMQEPLKEQILRNLTDTSKLNTTIKINVTKKINELKIKEDKLLQAHIKKGSGDALD